MDIEKLSDEELAAAVRTCCAEGEHCEKCPPHGEDLDDSCYDRLGLAAADRIEKLGKRLTETAGIALRLQERLDKIAAYVEEALREVEEEAANADDAQG